MNNNRVWDLLHASARSLPCSQCPAYHDCQCMTASIEYKNREKCLEALFNYVNRKD